MCRRNDTEGALVDIWVTCVVEHHITSFLFSLLKYDDSAINFAK